MMHTGEAFTALRHAYLYSIHYPQNEPDNAQDYTEFLVPRDSALHVIDVPNYRLAE